MSGGAYVLLRRVGELLFAKRQVDLLVEQLFPRHSALFRIGTDEYMRRVSYGVLVDGVWSIPKSDADGKWTIDGKACVYVRENLVKLDGVETRISTPSYEQWVRGLDVARDLAASAVNEWTA